MATKIQLENRIADLEAKLALTQLALDNARKAEQIAKASLKLEDLPQGELPSIRTQREIIKNAAELKLNEVVEWAGRNMKRNGNEDEIENQAEGIGILLARCFRYYGTPMLLVAAAGLEEANWHQECRVVSQMYQDLVARENQN